MEHRTFQPLVTLATKPNAENYNPIKIKIGSDDKGDNKLERKRVLEKIKKNFVVQDKRLISDKEEKPKVPVITNKKIVLKNTDYVIPEEKEEAEEKQEKAEEKEEAEEKQEEAEEKEEKAEEKQEEAEEDEIIDLEESVEVKENEENLEDDLERIVQELEKDEVGKKKPKKSKEEKEFEEKIEEGLPQPKEKIIVKASSYYMHNRRIFINKLTNLFMPFSKELKDNKNLVSCDLKDMTADFDLLTHQKVVRDYLNLYSPYRGLLIYHGLGSGKTCTSIAMAEGMKSNKRVFVMTPASLKMNFFSEMKKCGDALYKKNQYWSFFDTEGSPDYVIGVLARALNLDHEFINKKKSNQKRGVWLINVNKEPNFVDLTTDEQLQIDTQLNEMIRNKYFDINYNGLNMKKLELITNNFQRNPFDNCVVLIDEAHNFVSRIVNKLKKKDTIPYMLYNYLMNAENAKVILLSGTPIINYPNELGVLFNILRGNVQSFSIPITWQRSNNANQQKMNEEFIMKKLEAAKIKNYDYVNYSNDTLQITRNPFGFINVKKRGVAKGTTRKKGGKAKNNKTKKQGLDFARELLYTKENTKDEEESIDANIPHLMNPYYGGANEIMNKYNGVKHDDAGNVDQETFLNNVVEALEKKDQNGTIKVSKKDIVKNKYITLPDDTDGFINMFINTETAQLKNVNVFQKRILGLTSYFRSAQEELLPELLKTEDGNTYFIEKTDFSDYQFDEYQKIRKLEADKTEKMNKAKRMKKKNDDSENIFGVASTYRVFSRAYCNYVFPHEIKTALKTEEELKNEQLSENLFDEQFNNSEVVKKAVAILDSEKDGVKQYLTTDRLQETSPKFLRLLQNVQSLDHEGLHLIYSHFRTIYGIGVFRLVLMANGFAEFKLKKNGSSFTYEEDEENASKPKFVLYTGTESAEEKEIIRNIYNGNWDYVPLQISEKLKTIAQNNNNGEIIKIMMITASGAEGINLRNTRYVHIVEPYWHNVRLEQVIGRARRICSHQELPEEKRNVKVFLYMSTLSEQQRKDKNNIELTIRDISRLDKKTVVSTDETLFEIANIKQKINNQLLKSIKESAIDCNLYKESNKQEDLVCYGYGKVESNMFSSYPNLKDDLTSKDDDQVRMLTWEPVKATINGVEYAWNQDTQELYDYESYIEAQKGNGELLYIGKLVKQNSNYRIVKNE